MSVHPSHFHNNIPCRVLGVQGRSLIVGTVAALPDHGIAAGTRWLADPADVTPL
jgi:hypothetical protein